MFLSYNLFGMGHPALELAGHWVELGLSVETEISGRALTDWSSALNLALPPQSLSPDVRQSTKTLSTTWLSRKRRNK